MHVLHAAFVARGLYCKSEHRHWLQLLLSFFFVGGGGGLPFINASVSLLFGKYQASSIELSLFVYWGVAMVMNSNELCLWLPLYPLFKFGIT